MMYRQWAEGRARNYRPTMADLHALSLHLGQTDPVVIHNHPVAMHVLRLR